jgi:hypothetical protein
MNLCLLRSCSPEYGYGDQSPSPKIPVLFRHQMRMYVFSHAPLPAKQRIAFRSGTSENRGRKCFWRRLLPPMNANIVSDQMKTRVDGGGGKCSSGDEEHACEYRSKKICLNGKSIAECHQKMRTQSIGLAKLLTCSSTGYRVHARP